MPSNAISFAITFVIYCLVLGLVYWLLMQLVGAIPDSNLRTVAGIVVKVIFVLIVLYLVLQFLPPLPRYRGSLGGIPHLSGIDLLGQTVA